MPIVPAIPALSSPPTNVFGRKNPCAINVAKTHCIHGHEFTQENTRWKQGHRACKRCEYLNNKRNNWASKNPERHKSYHKQLRDETYSRSEAFITAHLHTHPCVDCGEKDIRVLQFDHVFGKRSFCPRGRVLRTLKQLEAEIAKCEVRCANCHARRHWKERHQCQ